MKNLYLITILIITNTLSIFAQEKKEKPGERMSYEYEFVRDPKTGIVPRDELENSRKIMLKMIKAMKAQRVSGAIPNIEWKERGPNNVAGRVRALLFDPNDSNKLKVWAGGVSGGLWYNNDITSTNPVWNKVDDFWDNIAITCIAYDKSNPMIMYVGTGEIGSGQVGNAGESATGGGGIWKTTNGGTTWSKLPSTTPDYGAGASGNSVSFRIINRIETNSNGHVFAATMQGVLRSTDGGASWTNLASGDLQSNHFVNDVEVGSDDIVYIGVGGGNTYSDVYKSSNSSVGSWVKITPTYSETATRTEIALAPSTSGSSQVLYAISINGNGTDYFSKSSDAGLNWTTINEPKQGTGAGAASFVGQQGFYDLILGVKENDPNVIYAGGITSAISIDGGTSWKNQFDYNFHENNFFVDQHGFARRPGFPNEAIFSNDGGVYYSTDWGNTSVTTPTFSKKVNGLNITQFYSVAIKGASGDGYIMGGAQDNGNQIITGPYATIGNAYEVQAGDGGLNFIDQDNPAIQIVSYTHNSYTMYENGDKTKPVQFTPNGSNNGTFINAADYDSQNNILYANNTASSDSDVKIMAYTIGNDASGYFTNNATLSFTGAGRLDVSFIRLGKVAGTIFLGTKNGDVFKATGINPGSTSSYSLVKIMDKSTFGEGFISSISTEDSDNLIVVTKGNYNIKSVYFTTDGGSNWISKDETGYGLPNIPVRYSLINPSDTKQVLLATELGVWSTSDITVANPEWSATNEKLANVRCDMLTYRPSDNTVAVATHGRGFFTAQLNQSNGCSNTLVLINPSNNISSGTETFRAEETITASNIVSGNANVTMTAGKSILLKPSDNSGGSTFEASSGTVFHAYISGCQN
ncbi:WD40/YVTN/BNR-like repeat-containing protein [Jiulongibacter sp. NS-SX5]|uniref:WD40/YVTN/BNR-like repeat-containing protein n=1 Tax=Jiulongibacter sp. NS-SX5 TaxID=3463854 RepID=UPI00405A16B4